MAKESTATRIKRLTQYVGDVWVFELSKALTKGKKFLVVSNAKPRTGNYNITMWYSDENGKITNNKPIKQFKVKTVDEAFKELGYIVK